MTVNEVKCVVVGDGAVGKTCLLVTYAKGEFPAGYCPTVFDNYSVMVDVGGRRVQLGLWDTAGQEGYDQLRLLSYPNTDVFVVCYSVMGRASFENVETVWMKDLAATGVPVVLVGTKTDLRDNPVAVRELRQKGTNPITTQQGRELAAKIGAVAHVECSALNGTGLRDVFEAVVPCALAHARGKRKAARRGRGCVVM